jgi:hypothetical protein
MSRSEPMIPGTTSAVILVCVAGMLLLGAVVGVLAGLQTLVTWAMQGL